MIFNLLVLFLDLYLCFSLFWGWIPTQPALAWGGMALLQLFFATQLWLFYIFFKSSAETKVRFEKPLQELAFSAMGFISFLFTFTLFRDLASVVLGAVGADRNLNRPAATAWILGLSVLAFAIGAFNARFRILSPQIQIPVDGLPESLANLKIVQLSDVHLGTGPKLDQVRAMVDRALSLRPEMIALTGDIIDGNVSELGPELRELARLRAPLGVYFVLGNHECYWNHRESIQAMKDAGIIPLVNTGVEVTARGQKIFIAGVNDPAAQNFEGEGPKIPVPPPSSLLNILLVHQPQLAKKVVALTGPNRYHLQLSGHTHGGQFFPWNIVVRWIYPIHRGLGQLQDLSIYVSSGTGYWGPPIRLGTDGEVTEIDMIPSRAARTPT